MISFVLLEPLLSVEESIETSYYIENIHRKGYLKIERPGNKYQLMSNDECGSIIFDSKIIERLCTYLESKAFTCNILLPLFNQFMTLNYEGFKQKRGIALLNRFNIFNANKEICKPFLARHTSINENSSDWISYYKDLDYLAVVPTIQLSLLEPGAFIVPHTDVGSKVATLMIYLPRDDRQVGNNDLATTFYFNKGSQRLTTMSRANISNEIRKVSTYFGHGASYLFFRSESSWHSVHIPETCKSPRTSININFNIAF